MQRFATCIRLRAGLGAALPYLKHALRVFGGDRCMFGSGWPVVTTAISHATWFKPVTDAVSSRPYHEPAAVFGGTARRVYSRRVHEEIRS
jgi:L-fuconolactonase